MPRLFHEGPYRFFFYSDEGSEPPHVHVQRDDMVAKFWLVPVSLQGSGGFNRSEISRIRAIVVDRQEQLIEAWHDYFGT
jgi:hypothetical protein